MSKINAQWHLAHVMPKNPTDRQRAQWHYHLLTMCNAYV